MSDPELAARAQRAAARLERSWDRWRRLHGLAAEQAQPVSSYVGYSLAEPWGRPRVVFGVGAEEAEQLSALLERDADADLRFSQGLLWEPEPSAHLAEGREHSGNGAQPAGPTVPQARQAEPEPAPAGEWAPGMNGFAAPPPGRRGFRPAPPADLTGPPDQGIGADLAGWTSGELPGQASAGLAAWPPADGTERTTARHGHPMPGQPGDGSWPADADPGAPWLRMA